MALSFLSRAIVAGVALVAAGSAMADQTIQVEMNQAKIIKLSRAADTVVVGNPQIADASVQDAKTIVITGKGFGRTNLVVMGEDGTPIVDQQISVSRDSASTIRIYRRAAIQTLHCSPYCESAYKSPSEATSDTDMQQQQ